MADENTKVLKDIQKKLKTGNNSEAQLKDMYEKSMKAFPADKFKSLTEEQAKAVKDQRASLKTAISTLGNISKVAESGEGTQNALSRFLGVDFTSEFFRSFKSMRQDSKLIASKLGDLGKALKLDKISKAAGGFWDFLKKLLGVGLVTIGFLSFLEGWNNADKIFQGIPIDWTERLAAGLATLVGAFLGLDEGEIATLAKDLNQRIESTVAFLKKDFKNLFTAIGNSLDNMGAILDDVLFIVGLNEDEDKTMLGATGSIFRNLKEITTNLWNSDSILAKILVGLAAIKIGTKLIAGISTLGTVFTTLGSIAAILGGGSIVAGIGVAVAAISLIGGIFNAFANFGNRWEQFRKDWDNSQGFLDKFGSIFKLIDGVVYDIADGIIKTITFGKFNAKDVDNLMRKFDAWIAEKFTFVTEPLTEIIDSITGFFTSISEWISNKIDGIKSFFGIETDTESPESAAARAAREAAVARLDQKAIKDSSNYDQYLKTLDSMKESGLLNEEEYNRERAQAMSYRMADQREGSFARFTNVQNNTNNNIISKAKPEPNKTMSAVDPGLAAATGS